MTEHTDNGLNLGNFVFDDNNQDRSTIVEMFWRDL